MTRDEACLKALNLLRWQAKVRCHLRGDDLDDCVQEAAVLFLRRFHQFPLCRGKLGVYSWWQTRRACRSVAHQRMLVCDRTRKLLEDAARNRRVTSGDKVVAEREEAEHAVVEHAHIRGLVDRLPRIQRETVVRLYGLEGQPPVTMATLGSEVGVTKQAISVRLRNAVTELRRLLKVKEAAVAGC